MIASRGNSFHIFKTFRNKFGGGEINAAALLIDVLILKFKDFFFTLHIKILNFTLHSSLL
jgi:hypothetical protein